MKFLLFFTLLTLLVVSLHAAETTTFPSCALECNTALFSGCSLTSNTTCFCESDTRPTALLNCVESKCTTKEYFTTRRLYEQKCDITPLQGPSLVQGGTMVPLVLATFFFVARMIAKSSGLAGGWGWDDYTIIVSFVLGIAIFVLNIYMVKFGFGRNIWDVPFDDITMFYKCFQGLAVMYKIQISLAKISVCLFMLRIFQARKFRYMSYALMGLNAATGITWACVDSFRCLPTYLTWTGWMNEEQGKCIDFITSILINCLVNIFLDSILIVMPVYEVIKLQLPLKKKLTVALMFVVGSVLTIIAIIRVVVFWNNRWGANQTLGLYPLIRWSVIETQISVLCACLPAFRALIGRWFPALLGGSKGRTYPSNTEEYTRQTDGNSKINKSVTYSVNYAARSDTNSEVELVDMDAKYAR
ncbi:hypothetical protein PENANT_c065G04882 [Penicillium antarcticum]|uniref:CFEM domain-containing protein n=1 Tax=Penicillium antarcticum TaxID=416450 RepID=A0A1V6PR84_9EURO|nr:uncharacterized protein N7508_004003 [Penicillium antarcticum]KAJ5308624.1 hypothetical protein N7508_004003 [Penicillium antarcticum]OQD79046.1 hypothetical protein PENANT_c065G04882 [Penicillium antarcticum]